ncbi:hypothetical protein L1887_58301 [Cichorium endivia]|nr:hypothetical protein L1887_58301 [Cichorium endivia]
MTVIAAVTVLTVLTTLKLLLSAIAFFATAFLTEVTDDVQICDECVFDFGVFSIAMSLAFAFSSRSRFLEDGLVSLVDWLIAIDWVVFSLFIIGGRLFDRRGQFDVEKAF